MPRLNRILQDEYPYHVSTKTAGRIFVFKPWTYKIIIDVLVEAEKRYNVKIHHFKMMHTHYHMLISTPHSNLSDFQWFVNHSIARRLNRRMGRSGHLWEKRFGASIVENEEYLGKCMKYIYVNGVNPHFSPISVTRRRRSPWLQGTRRKKRGGIANAMLSTFFERDAVDMGLSIAAVGNW